MFVLLERRKLQNDLLGHGAGDEGVHLNLNLSLDNIVRGKIKLTFLLHSLNFFLTVYFITISHYHKSVSKSSLMNDKSLDV